jgi:hypothetical protein
VGGAGGTVDTDESSANVAGGMPPDGVEIGLYEGTKHSRATDLLRQGVSERTLQALLGHRDARSTRRYARLADEALVQAIRPRRGDTESR